MTMPPIAPSAALRPKTSIDIWLALMPISPAACRLMAQARTALPSSVRSSRK